MGELSDLDKYILDWLLHKPPLPQDKIWLDNFEERLRKLEQMNLVKKNENVWSLTELGRMCAVMQEGNLPKACEPQ